VEAADLVEAVLVEVTPAVDLVVAVSAVSAAVTLVAPASAALTEEVFARRQLSQVRAHVLTATGVSVA
jgi:hypothetical protein